MDGVCSNVESILTLQLVSTRTRSIRPTNALTTLRISCTNDRSDTDTSGTDSARYGTEFEVSFIKSPRFAVSGYTGLGK